VDYNWYSALGIAVRPKGQGMVALSYRKGRFAYLLWNIAAGKLQAEFPIPGRLPSSVTWRPGGLTLAVAVGDWFVTLWDSTTGTPLRTLTLRTGPPPHGLWSPSVSASLAWRPDGKLLATGLSPEGIIKLWHPEGGQLAAILTGPAPGASPLAWSPDGKTLAAAYEDHTVVLWDPAARRRRAVLRGHIGSITALGWSPNGRSLATASEDGSLRLWDGATGKERVAFYSLDDGTEWLAITPDGFFATSAHGADLLQWRQQGKLQPPAKLRRRFERPDRVRQALGGG
jgi:WD40 repeat protein